MKPMAYDRHKYSGKYYKFVREIVGDSSTLKYYFVKNVSLTANVDSAGRLTIKSDEPFPIGTLIADIKDVNGTPILDDMVWQINALEPVMNAFNSVEMYRQRAVKFQGKL